MTKWAYCRVSTTEQDLSLQRQWALQQQVAPTHILAEKQSGSVYRYLKTVASSS